MSKEMVRIGECNYCHQQVSVSATDSMTDEEVCQLATESCSCEEAREQRSLQEGCVKAKNRVQELFSDNTAVQNLLLLGVDAVKNGDIEKVNVSLNFGVKAQISLTSKGKIKVNRTRTETKTYEE